MYATPLTIQPAPLIFHPNIQYPSHLQPPNISSLRSHAHHAPILNKSHLISAYTYYPHRDTTVLPRPIPPHTPCNHTTHPHAASPNTHALKLQPCHTRKHATAPAYSSVVHEFACAVHAMDCTNSAAYLGSAIDSNAVNRRSVREGGVNWAQALMQVTAQRMEHVGEEQCWRDRFG
jgi:hypothetical protein